MDVSRFFSARYQPGGRGPHVFDCYGLFWALNRELGRNVPDHPSPEAAQERDCAITAGIETDGWQRIDLPKPWCAVTFCLKHPYVTHVGMVLADQTHFIHIQRAGGVRVERLDSPVWEPKIRGFFEWK